MNKQIKQIWLNALRNNKYKKCTGKLRNKNDNKPDTFCCLGVLQDLYHKEKKSIFRIQNFNRGYPINIVLRWAGIKLSDCYMLADRNDGNGGIKQPQSFRKIADYIEHNL